MQCVFHSHRAHIKYSVRLLPQLDYTLSVDLCSGKMQIAHLGNRMSETFIHQSLRCLAAVYMRDWNTCAYCCGAYSEHFKPITQNDK